MSHFTGGNLARGAVFGSLLVLLFQCLSAPASAEVYLAKNQALKAVFGECAPEYVPQKIPAELKEKLRREYLWGIDHEEAHFFRCNNPGGKSSFALIDEEIGKHLPITYIVGISAEGTVTRVDMMVFREIRGWEARERRFMKQFERKELRDELSVGRSLANVTGATLSSKAIAKGVRRALAMWEFFFSEKAGRTR